MNATQRKIFLEENVTLPFRLDSLSMIKLTGCWEWYGNKHYRGYGEVKVKVKGKWKKMKAHIASYLVTIGPIPIGKVLGHTCHNTGCVNPWHVKPVTQAQNMRDKYKAGRANHPSGENHYRRKAVSCSS